MKSRIRPRMMSGFLVMSAVFILLGIFAIFYSDRMEKNTTKIFSENIISLKSAEELEIALLDMKGLTSNYLLSNEQNWLEVFEDKKEEFLTWLETAKKNSHSSDEDIILDDIENLFQSYLSYQRKVVQQFQQGDLKLAYLTLTNQMHNVFKIIFNKCEELLLSLIHI